MQPNLDKLSEHDPNKRLNPEGYLTKINTGRHRPDVQPLTLLYTILTEKVPLLYTSY